MCQSRLRRQFRHFCQTCKARGITLPEMVWDSNVMFPADALSDIWRTQTALCWWDVGEIQFSVPKKLGYGFFTLFQSVSQMWFLSFSDQGASSYYCKNFYYKSPCIFSVAARDKLWASRGRGWVTYMQYGGHHSLSFTEIKAKSYHALAQIDEKQITRVTLCWGLFVLI